MATLQQQVLHCQHNFLLKMWALEGHGLKRDSAMVFEMQYISFKHSRS